MKPILRFNLTYFWELAAVANICFKMSVNAYSEISQALATLL